MIKVNIFISPINLRLGYEISGHAEFGPHGGDIVCAAVSILGYTTLNSILEIAGVDKNQMSVVIDDAKGYMKVLVDDKIIEDPGKRDVQTILNTLAVGMETIKEGYPKYITIEYRGGGTHV